jgi:hypothetical protein
MRAPYSECDLSRVLVEMCTFISVARTGTLLFCLERPTPLLFPGH